MSAVDQRAAISSIRLRMVGPGFGFVALTTGGGWSISGIRVRLDGGAVVAIDWPFTEAKDGQRYPVCVPPPGLRERIEDEIRARLADVS